MVWIGRPEQETELIFRQVRAELGLRADYEFHASQITKQQWKDEMPQRFFQLLRERGLAAQAWCVGIEKARTKLPIEFDGKRLTNELLARTLRMMPRGRVDHMPLTIDERVHDKKAPKIVREMRTYITNSLKTSRLLYTVGPVHARESHHTPGIQLADYLAAAVLKPWPECQPELKHWVIAFRWI